MTRNAAAAPRRDPATGTWFFVVDVTGSDGKRHQTRRRGFTTKKEAQAALDDVRSAVTKWTYVTPTSVTLRQFVEATWLPAVKPTLEDSTRASYARNLRQHVLPRLGDLKLVDVGPEHLNRLYGELLDAGRLDGKPGGLSARTVRYVATIIGKVFADAVKWRKLTVNPAERADPPSERSAHSDRPDPWTADELRGFLGRCGDNRYRPLYTFLALTGCRRGEALGLRWADLSPDLGLAAIRRTITAVEHRVKVGGQTKSGKEREVELDAPTIAALREWRARQAQERLLMGVGYQDNDLVFCHPDGRPYHPERVSREFDRMVERLGLRRVRLHDLRHGWATMALKAGIHPKVVQERLGHANVGVTLNIYSHTDPELRAGAAERVAGLVFGA